MSDATVQKTKSPFTKTLIVICIIMSCTIIAAAVIIPTVINENQKKLTANQDMTSVIDNIRQNIKSGRDVDGDYTYYWVEDIDAYKQKGSGLLNSEYVNPDLKDEYNLLIEKANYYSTMNDIGNNIEIEKYATANRMLNQIDSSKPYCETKWQQILRETLDRNMCIKLNYERIEKVMKDLMKENGIINSYKDVDRDEWTNYPREPYGICGLLTVEDYIKSSGTGSISISTENDGVATYQLMKAKDYYELTQKNGIYAAFVFTGGGAYKSRYYTYENSITNPNGDYRDF